MVITPKFCIGHIPKTGGDAMHQICAAVFEAGLESNYTCDTLFGEIKNRPFTGNEPYRVLILRRLPSYIMSWAHHMKNLGGAKLWTADECSNFTTADESLIRVTNNFKIGINRWLRCEALRDDLDSFLREMYVDSYNSRYSYIVHNCPTKSQMQYNHSIWSYFKKDQVRKLYELNPHWAAFEFNLFGKLMV